MASSNKSLSNEKSRFIVGKTAMMWPSSWLVSPPSNLPNPFHISARGGVLIYVVVRELFPVRLIPNGFHCGRETGSHAQKDLRIPNTLLCVWIREVGAKKCDNDIITLFGPGYGTSGISRVDPWTRMQTQFFFHTPKRHRELGKRLSHWDKLIAKNLQWIPAEYPRIAIYRLLPAPKILSSQKATSCKPRYKIWVVAPTLWTRPRRCAPVHSAGTTGSHPPCKVFLLACRLHAPETLSANYRRSTPAADPPTFFTSSKFVCRVRANFHNQNKRTSEIHWKWGYEESERRLRSTSISGIGGPEHAAIYASEYCCE